MEGSASEFKQPKPLSKTSIRSNVFTKPKLQSESLVKSEVSKLPAESKEKSEAVSEVSPKLEIEKSLSHGNKSIYTIPDWSGVPPQDFSLEVIKQGTIISTISLTKPSLIFGRLPACDIQLDHPTISRYHAAIQYCRGVESRPPGFYVYDFGSTHGTFMNKRPQQANVYYELKVGHMLKFGMSTRIFVLQGPVEEQKETEKESVSIPDQNVCDWGMQEDAEEDGNENPFALSTENEELYLSDPKKTLRGWFEREGYEIEYKVEENSSRHFVCSIQLPVDNSAGDYLTVTGAISGRKKESVVACALEACRTLDRLGLLCQSHHESRQQKKKNWEEDEFYDSDEDPFLDRTGSLDKKREWRKKLGKNSSAQSYESIVKKLEAVDNDIHEVEEKLHRSRTQQMTVVESEEVDPLDCYMAQISDPQTTSLDRVTISKLKSNLLELKKQKNMLEQLKSAAEGPQFKSLPCFTTNTQKIVEPKKICEPAVPSDSFITTVDTDSSVTDVKDKGAAITTETTKELNNEIEVKLMAKPVSQDVKTEPTNLEMVSEIKKSISSHKLKRPSELTRRDTKKISKSDSKAMYSNTEKYSMWVPPTGQSGDGSTHLNQKYGY